MRSKLIFSDFAMTSADTMGGVTYRQTINSGTDLQYGCAAMAEVSFSFRTENYDKGIVFKGQRFELQISQAETGENYQTVGFFYVDTVNIKGGKTSVVAYDGMYAFDATADTFMTGIEYPITLYTLLQNLCNRAGVQLSNTSITNGNVNISKKISLSGGTLRNLLSYIAAAAASYAYINPEGKLQLSEYTDTGISLNNTQYVSCWLAEYATDAIARVTLSTPDATVSVDNPDISISGTTVNEYVVYDNPVINACADRTSLAEGILEKVISLSYTPSEITLLRDHGVTAGDIITVDGTTTVVMEKTMKPSGVTISATGNQWRDLYVSNEEQKTVQNNYDTSNAITEAETAKKEAETATQTADEVKKSLGEYVKTSNLSASIDTYLDSASGKASVVAAVEGTYQKISDMSGYVQTTQLSAKIGAYIDTQAGTAKIVNNLSGTFVTEDSLGNYVQKTDLNAGIESYIDTAAGTAKVVSAVSGTYVTQTNLNSTLGNYAQKSDIPALDGYLLESELNAGIETYIETASGKAQIVSAVSGTYVTQSNLNTTLNSYPTTTEMNSALSSYVKTTNLNSSIGTYIDSATGKAKVVSAASGTYQTISGMSDYAKTSALTTIEQSVSDVEAAITLSSSYSKDTIGTNVYALLQLVSNANSSSIKIKADKIDFTGFTTFLRASDLGSSGSTTIDGGRIMTGTISADRIDVDNLKVSTIYGKGSYRSYTAMTSDTTDLYIGGASFSASYSNIYLAAKTKVYFGSTGVFEICVDMANDSIYSTFTASLCGTSSYPWGEIHGGGTSSYHIVIADTVIRPSASSTYSSYSLGTSTYPWNAVYTKKLYLNGTEFSGGSNFAGSLVNMGGTTTYYIQATTSRQLRPNTSSTTYPFYLGTSGYYWHYAYIGSVAAYIGSSASSKLGFFGTTPVARKTVANTATVATLITALKAYGLIY